MAMSRFASMAHTDDQMYDLAKGRGPDYEPPEYPDGLCFTVPQSVLDEAEAGEGAPGDTMRFSLMAEVTSVFCGMDDSRVELRLTQFAGENGKFIDVADDEDMPWMSPSICLCGAELDKLGLEADCELGDTIHLIGTVRLESTSNDGFSGERAKLQVVEMTFEDESEESRKG